MCVLTAHSFLFLSDISLSGCATVSVSRWWFLSLSGISLYDIPYVYWQLIPFCLWVAFHCLDVPQFLYPGGGFCLWVVFHCMDIPYEYWQLIPFLPLSGISVYGCATVSVSWWWFLSLSSTSLYGHSCIHSLFLSISEWHICHSFCILAMVFVSEWYVIVWMCHRFCILAMVLSLSGTSVSGHSCVYWQLTALPLWEVSHCMDTPCVYWLALLSLSEFYMCHRFCILAKDSRIVSSLATASKAGGNISISIFVWMYALIFLG